MKQMTPHNRIHASTFPLHEDLCCSKMNTYLLASHKPVKTTKKSLKKQKFKNKSEILLFRNAVLRRKKMRGNLKRGFARESEGKIVEDFNTLHLLLQPITLVFVTTPVCNLSDQMRKQWSYVRIYSAIYNLMAHIRKRSWCKPGERESNKRRLHSERRDAWRHRRTVLRSLSPRTPSRSFLRPPQSIMWCAVAQPKTHQVYHGPLAFFKMH